MKLLDKYEGIKVVTICPGAVDSPLWDADKRERTHFNEVESLKPDEVAAAMIELVQDGKYGGGTLLEIMANNGPKVMFEGVLILSNG
jgi:short-subunit dehydrogenase